MPLGSGTGIFKMPTDGAGGPLPIRCLGRLSRPRVFTHNLETRFPTKLGSRHRAQPVRHPLHFVQPRSGGMAPAPSCCRTPDGSHGL